MSSRQSPFTQKRLGKNELGETGFTDVENVEDQAVVLVGQQETYMILFLVSLDRVHPEVKFMSKLGCRKLKYLRSNQAKSEYLFLNYSDPAALTYLVLGSSNTELIRLADAQPNTGAPGQAGQPDSLGSGSRRAGE